MANDVRQQLARVTLKSQMIVERYNALSQQHQQATARIDELERELQSKRNEIAQLRNKIEFLKAATTISPSRQDVAQTKVMLSGILREIDTCIEQLTH